MSSEGVNRLEKMLMLTVSSGSQSFTQDWKLHKEPTAARVRVVVLETGCHSVMGCICSFAVIMASLLAANEQAQKTLAEK